MFDGDANAAGRREARMKKDAQKETYTNKVGFGSGFTPSSMPGPAGGNGGTEQQKAAAEKPAFQFDASKVGTGSLFTHRVKAGRHAYEIEIVCQLPLEDMAANAGKRSLTWFCADDQYTVVVPEGFDVEALQVLSDDFATGRCSVSVPVKTRNVFA